MGKIRKATVVSVSNPLIKAALAKVKAAEAKVNSLGKAKNSMAQVAKQKLVVAKIALKRAREVATTNAAAGQYWTNIKARRQQVLTAFNKCKTAQCGVRDKELRKITRLPATKGTWQTPSGKPAVAGDGLWVPSSSSPLVKTLARHGKTGVPFKDGKPDFTGFPPKGMTSTPQVQIEMSGKTGTDITRAENALIAEKGINTKGSGQPGTWHHESDGVTMSYVDKDVHTAYKTPSGLANPGTPHSGGDSMTRDPVF